MQLSDAIERLAIATLADGRSERTVTDYRQKLDSLVDFLGPDQDVGAVSVQDLRRYVASLRGKRQRYQTHGYRPKMSGGLSLATIAGHIRAVKRLFNFLETDSVIEDNPARALRTPRAPKGKEPKALSLEDLEALLVATKGTKQAQLRDRALVLFLADTGCRLGGLVGLRLHDVDLERSRAFVVEKGSKRRAVYLSAMTSEALGDWLAVRPAESEAVFTTLTPPIGRPLTGMGVTQILRRLKKRAGIQGPCNPHAFRHAFAREYLRNGGDLATLSDLLGHSDIDVTARHYAVFLPDELQERHQRFGPVPRLGSKDDS